MHRNCRAGIQPAGAARTTLVELLEGRRLLSAGDIDPTYGTAGSATFPKSIGSPSGYNRTDVFAQANGDVVIANGDLARYTAAGDLDPTFGAGGVVALPHEASAREADVSQLADGDFISTGTDADGDLTVTRFTADGAVDATFGTGGTAVVPLPTGSQYGGLNGAAFSAAGTDGTIYVGLTLDDQTSAANGMEPQFAMAIVTAAGVAEGAVRAYPIGSFGSSVGSIAVTGGRVVLGGYAAMDGGPTHGVLLGLTPDGTVDTAFGTGGQATFAGNVGFGSESGLAVQPNGDLVAVGSTASAAGLDEAVVAWFSADGQPDASFGTGGVVVSPDPLGTPLEGEDNGDGAEAAAVGVEPDGSLIVVGQSQGQLAVVRYSATGVELASDASPTMPGYSPVLYTGGSNLSSVGIDGDQVVVAGSTLMRLNADLTTDTTFANAYAGLAVTAAGTVGYSFTAASTPGSAAAGSDGSLVELGSGLSPYTGATLNVIRLTANGVVDPTFTAALPTAATAVAVQSDGKVLVAGGATPGVVRLNADGSVDATFTSPAAVLSGAYAIDVLSDGDVVVGAGVDVYRFTDTGAADPTFATAGVAVDADRAATALAMAADGSIFTVGGSVLEKFNAAGQPDPTFGTAGQVAVSNVAGVAMSGVAVEPSGRVVVVDNGYARALGYTSAGVLDATFGDVGTADLPTVETAVMLESDGKLLVYGGGGGIVRLTADGVPDAAFGDDGLSEQATDALVQATASRLLLVNGVTTTAVDAGPLQLPGSTLAVQLTKLPYSSTVFGPTDLTPFGSYLYYVAASQTGGPTLLWRTDGTTAGTVPVTLTDGAGITGVTGILAGPDALYVAAGSIVYQLTGTAAPVALPVATASDWTLLGATPGHLFLIDDPAAPELSVTDGTAAGTVDLGAYPAGQPYSATPTTLPVVTPDAVAVGDVLYFVDDGKLVRTDGTVAGTTTVQSFTSDNLPDALTALTAAGTDVYFVCFDDNTSAPDPIRKLYVSDGTPAGTVDLLTAEVSDLTAVGDRLYFAAPAGSDAEPSLYLSEGTVAGTTNLTHTVAGVPYVASLAALDGDRALVIGESAAGELTGLYVTDGTASGTAVLHSFPTGEPYTRAIAVGTGGVAYVTAMANNLEFDQAILYRTDGTTAGTTTVATSFPIPGTGLIAAAGTVFADTAESYDTDYPYTPANPGHAAPGQLLALTTITATTPSPTPTPKPSPTPTPGLSPVVARSTVPTTAVAGTPVRGSIRVTLTNTTGSAITAKRASVVRVYATRTGQIDSASLLVGTRAGRVRLAAGGAMTLTVAVRSAALTAGDYQLLAEATDAAGDVVAATEGPALTVAPPTVLLTATVAAVAPAALTPGRPATVTVTVANDGNVSAAGPLSFDLGLTTDGTTVAVPLATVSRRVTSRPGHTVDLRLRFRVPPNATPGAAYRTLLTLSRDDAAVVGTTVGTVIVTVSDGA